MFRNSRRLGSTHNNQARTTAPRRPPCRPRVEALEDRTAPATFVVENLNDTGVGSLRGAIIRANDEVNNPGQDTIVFAAAVRGGTVSLTTFTNLPVSLPDVPQPAGPSAFIITSLITIQGTGETITRAGAAAFRLFQVTAAGNLSLWNLTLSNGLAQGGDGAGSGGGAAGLGGAVYNQRVLSVFGCTLNGNQAVGGSGARKALGRGGGGLGGPAFFSLPNYYGGSPNGAPDGGNGGFGGGGGPGKPDGNPLAGGNGGFGGGGGEGWSLASGGNGGFGGGGGSSEYGTGGVGGPGGFGGVGGRHGNDLITGGGGGAGRGGAVFNQGGTVNLINSTLTGNTAQ